MFLANFHLAHYHYRSLYNPEKSIKRIDVNFAIFYLKFSATAQIPGGSSLISNIKRRKLLKTKIAKKIIDKPGNCFAWSNARRIVRPTHPECTADRAHDPESLKNSNCWKFFVFLSFFRNPNYLAKTTNRCHFEPRSWERPVAGIPGRHCNKCVDMIRLWKMCSIANKF